MDKKKKSFKDVAKKKTQKRMEAPSVFRTKKEGPIHFIYVGQKHIGHVIEPIVGGNIKRAKNWLSVSKLLNKKHSHDDKKSAIDWVTTKSGVSTKMMEGPEQQIVGATPHGNEVKGQEAAQKRLIKKNPQAMVKADISTSKVAENFIRIRKQAILQQEEMFDKDKNKKDPKAGPKPEEDDEGNLSVEIKRTETGKPGDSIILNPKIKQKKPGDQKSMDKPEHKKSVNNN